MNLQKIDDYLRFLQFIIAFIIVYFVLFYHNTHNFYKWLVFLLCLYFIVKSRIATKVYLMLNN
jgi:hypothetical protein